MNKGLLIVALFFGLSLSAQGQSFSSGSTGADGALDLAAMICTTCEIQLPESGVLNYTTVNVPAGKTLKFKSNLRNSPVIMLAQGNINVAGSINVDADQNTPGPGGFYGGAPNQPGFGPGGGIPGPSITTSSHGIWVGPLSLVPIIGGSGGAGVNPGCNSTPKGGGGGGAIAIASSSTITLAGNIRANGSAVSHLCSGAFLINGTRGSGGAIRLVANSVNISGSLSGSVIRLEAPQGAIIFTGTSNSPAVLSTINPIVVSSNAPSLQIVSIGSYAVPSYSGTRFDTVDLLLPNQLTDPINVLVQAGNIPVGTQVKIIFSGSPNATFTLGTLSGTLASSTTTLTVSNLTRSVATYLFVYATFDLPLTSLNLNPKGKDQVAKVRLEAAPGAKPKYVFLRNDGSEIDAKKLPQKFLQEFGTN